MTIESSADSPRSMRVTHVVSAIAEEASGPSYSVVRLAESLIERGVDVRLAALDWAPIRVVPSFAQLFPLGFASRRIGRSPALAKWLESNAASGEADVFHDHGFWLMSNVYPGQVARRHDIPYFVSPRGTLSSWAMKNGSRMAKRIFWPLVQRPSLAATSCFHATAESEMEDIRRMGFRQPIAIIPNGVDIPRAKTPNEGNQRTLLFLGRIHPTKGVDLLLKAWQIVHRRFPDWQLRVVGPDNLGYLAKMKDLASNLGVDRVEFSGPLFGEAKFAAYRDAELFVLPTHSENFGMTVAEALSVGTPAIVTKGAPWSGLEGRGAGWWIDIGVDSLVGCLTTAMSLPGGALADMGRRGRAWMEAEFSWVEIARKMVESYRWVISGGAKPDWIAN